MKHRHGLWLLIVMSLLILQKTGHCEESSAVVKHQGLVYAEVSGAGNETRSLHLDLFVPTTSEPPPLVVWIHGGGWRNGSRRNPKLMEVTKNGYALASLSYRFSKEAIFPAQVHDCKAAIRWLRANSNRYGYNAEWIAVAGSSAGGHLALLLGTSSDVTELEGEVGGNLKQSSSVQAVIDYFGPSDFVLRGKTQPERAYTNQSGSYALLGGKDGKVAASMERLASPATYVSSDDPPLLIFHGTADKTVLLDQSERMVELYDAVGLDVELITLEGAGHGGKRFFEGDSLQKAIHFLNAHRPD
ncbi:alpha/beta hydrolase [Rhodopirellula baltica]|uniref:Lipase/esterase n=1 Tax=Rhodopirellula baltica WH47 TaxID=991778 RepID=F2APP7_RHOBT|nr:alpha/beta hydrolase [Rhodopirellula baltica]EGF28314.1 lipase/esterase [Rhodopirellula baltica WH47]